MTNQERGSRRRQLAVALAGVLIFVSQAAASDFYYYGGHPVPLQRDPLYVAVDYAPGASPASFQAISLPNGTTAQGEVVFDLPRRGRCVLRLATAQGGTTAPALAAKTLALAAKALAVHPQVARTYPVFRNPKTGLLVYAFDEIIVHTRPGIGPAELVRFGAPRGISILEQNADEPEIYLLRVGPTGGSALDAANEYALSGLCEWAEPNLGGQILKYAINDPLFPQQWHLHNTGQTGGTPGADVDALGAWTISSGSPNVIIALLDDGCDLNHEDLHANIYTNPGEIPGNGIDDDHNGYIDDVHGWDFYDNDNNPNHSNPSGSTEGHGSATAGIAAAVGNNGIGVAGIAYRCKILPLKIFKDDNFAGEYEVSNAIRYGARMADVLSNSWGGGAPSEALEAGFRYALQFGRGCPIVFAAGNSGYPEVEYPATSPWTIAVGATDSKDLQFSYSSYGPHLTVTAPSGNYTTDRTGLGVGYDGGFPDTTGNYTGLFSGTSSACPLAAGIVALMLSVNPNLTAFQVQAILQKTADKVNPAAAQYNSYGFSLKYGYGRVNASRAVRMAQLGGPTEDQFEPNNTRATARLIDSGFYSALYAGDDDWYATDLQPYQDLIVQLYFMQTQGDLQLQVYNPAGALVASSMGTTNTEQLEVSTGSGGGRWTIRVFGKNGAKNYYHMFLNKRPPDDRFEPNDTLAEARLILPGDYGALRAYDPDYYRLHVHSGEKISALIRFFNDVGDLDLYLLSTTGTILSESATVADLEGVWHLNTGPDTDFILFVDNYNNCMNSYSMHVEVGPGQDDRFEPNNTRSQAALIGPGTYTHLQPYDDDWYKVVVGSRQIFEGEIRFLNAIGDLDMELYNQAGQWIDSSTGVCNFERVMYVNTANTATVVYPLVHPFTTNYPDYTLIISLSQLRDDKYEVNNDFWHAPKLAMASYDNLMAMDADYFSIDAIQGKTVTAIVADEPSLPRLNATIYSPTGIPLVSTLPGQPVVAVADFVPTTGTFRVGIGRPTNATAVPYGLGLFVYDSTTTPSTSEDWMEPNDLRRKAHLVGPSAYVNLYCANDDYYTIHLAEGESLYVAIVFDNTLADLDLSLHDPWGQTIAVSAGSGSTELCVLKKAPFEGYYYIHVFPSQGASHYDLLIGRTVNPPKAAARHWELY